MIILRRLAPGLALTTLLLAPRDAEACGQIPPPASSIRSVSPAPGATGVARDAGIIVSGTTSPLYGDAILGADVELFDADSGALVPLVVGSWFSRSGPELRVAAHPVEPLEPLHSYRVEATTVDPETGDRSAPFVSQFETSDAVLEPLVLFGELEFSLRAAEADVLAGGSCGGSDTVVGKRRALFADVQLPVPRGGQGLYQGILHFADHTPLRVHPFTVSDYDPNDGEPHEVRLRQGFELEAGELLVLSQEVLQAEYAYAACFTFVVWDPAGHVAQSSACLPVLSPDEIRTLAQGEAPLEVAADESSAAEQVDSERAERHERGPVWSCAVATSTAARAPGWLALLLAFCLVRRLARQREA